MAHEWHTNHNRNPLKLINEFTGFKFNTDYAGTQEVRRIEILSGTVSNEGEAISLVTERSYGGETAYMIAYTPKKLSKGYTNAFANFREKYKEYTDFKKNLTIAYGRTASKVTCPECSSSINLKYGRRFVACPVCGSTKIISDSNWKILDTKKRLAEKAAENLAKEAEKNNVFFVCGIEWHC